MASSIREAMTVFKVHMRGIYESEVDMGGGGTKRDRKTQKELIE